MKNKIISILVVMLLIVSLPIATAQSKSEKNDISNNTKEMIPSATNVGDEYDQTQTDDYGFWPIPADQKLAQTFVPTHNKLSKFELKLRRVGDPGGSIKIHIRQGLYGENLRTVEKSSSSISTSPEWYDFTVSLLNMIPGETYAIVIEPNIVRYNEFDFLDWRCGGYDPYPTGEAWWTWPDGITFVSLEDWSVYDFCFKTYGRFNHPPRKPDTPSGPTSGNVGEWYEYSTLTTDLDGDKLYYKFDWGDGTDSGWLGLYDPAITVSTNHPWTIEGTYQIKVKAKDIYEDESEWSDPLAVTMPKNKPCTAFLFLQLLKQHSHMFPLLRQLC